MAPHELLRGARVEADAIPGARGERLGRGQIEELLDCFEVLHEWVSDRVGDRGVVRDVGRDYQAADDGFAGSAVFEDLPERGGQRVVARGRLELDGQREVAIRADRVSGIPDTESGIVVGPLVASAARQKSGHVSGEAAPDRQGATRAHSRSYVTEEQRSRAGCIVSPNVNALAIELESRGVRCERQLAVPILYRGADVGWHRLDLLVAGLLVVELKAVKTIEDVHFAVVRSYLKATARKHGLVLNFAKPTPSGKRVIASLPPHQDFLVSRLPYRLPFSVGPQSPSDSFRTYTSGC
jgi:GxxExxY protein